mmetsp:Transcript_25782/g.57799  ORF Transcript_25782/g.57799 Transcript_25782/m.57799 type:complete len:269 (+) Transcript_25782:148-954(+)
MVRTVLIISTSSGVPLFSKELGKSIAQPRLVGSLLTAMVEQSVHAVGAPLSYMELSSVAVTLARDEARNVCCAIFHDPSFGPDFGKLLASQILHAFLEEYSEDLQASSFGFHRLLPSAIFGVIRPVLSRLQAHPSGAITRALVVSLDGSIIEWHEGLDRLTLVANLDVVLSCASELMTSMVRSIPRETGREDESTAYPTLTSLGGHCFRLSNAHLLFFFFLGERLRTSHDRRGEPHAHHPPATSPLGRRFSRRRFPHGCLPALRPRDR